MGTKAVKTNRDKLASLYEDYYDKVAHYIYSRIGDKTEAEDLARRGLLESSGVHKDIS